jgi:hypothetical protein
MFGYASTGLGPGCVKASGFQLDRFGGGAVKLKDERLGALWGGAAGG